MEPVVIHSPAPEVQLILAGDLGLTLCFGLAEELLSETLTRSPRIGNWKSITIPESDSKKPYYAWFKESERPNLPTW
jgi:hypothetical protein